MIEFGTWKITSGLLQCMFTSSSVTSYIELAEMRSVIVGLESQKDLVVRRVQQVLSLCLFLAYDIEGKKMQELLLPLLSKLQQVASYPMLLEDDAFVRIKEFIVSSFIVFSATEHLDVIKPILLACTNKINSVL